MKKKHLLLSVLMCLAGMKASCQPATQQTPVLEPETAFNDSLQTVSGKNTHQIVSLKYDSLGISSGKVKNIILLIGDGMSMTQIYAGLTANKGRLNLELFPFTGYSKTSASDNYVTDSAAGATALSCGIKSYNGAIGVGPDKNGSETILETAEKAGWATGLISTSSITHATPASFIAHQEKRSMQEEIAGDFLKTDIDVFIGGGQKFFEKRKDERNLSKELEAKGYTIARTLEEAEKFTGKKLAALTAENHNPPMSENRGDYLGRSVSKALEILSKNKKGFFLMAEASQIDWGGHATDLSYTVDEMLDFDKVIGQVLEFAVKNKGTLVIVTADHETGGLSLNKGDMKTGSVSGKFTTDYHTGVPVPVFAFGPGAAEFSGMYENIQIYHKMMKVSGLKK